MELTGIANQKGVSEVPLREEQVQALEDIASRYDPENLSRDDLKNLRADLADAGLLGSSQARQYLQEAGFSLRGKAAGPQQDGANASTELQKSELWGLFRQFQMGKISEAEFKTAVGDFRAGMLMRASF